MIRKVSKTTQATLEIQLNGTGLNNWPKNKIKIKKQMCTQTYQVLKEEVKDLYCWILYLQRKEFV